jgi:predicted CopG family antitoxin
MYDMTKMGEIKIGRLDKVITVRMTDDDYNTLLRISEGKKSNVSDIIRTIIRVVIDLAKKNNSIFKAL